MGRIKLSTIFGEVKAYTIITFGLLMYVVGWVLFLIPNNMVGGGVSGIGVVLLYAFNIPVSVSFFVINLVLILIALKILGSGFGVKTVYAIIMCSLMYEFVPSFLSPEFIQEVAIDNGKFLCAMFGGVMSGLGVGLCFSQGGSTGGTDIVALMVCKFRNMSPGRIILLLDVFIIASSLLLPADIVNEAGEIVGKKTWGERLAIILYGYIVVISCSYTIDLFISGTKQSLQIFIFSKKYEQIADAIISQVGRGVTILDAQGWYTKEHNKLVMVIARKADINLIYKVIREVDRDAFISVGSVSEVFGQGFDQIKK